MGSQWNDLFFICLGALEAVLITPAMTDVQPILPDVLIPKAQYFPGPESGSSGQEIPHAGPLVRPFGGEKGGYFRVGEYTAFLGLTGELAEALGRVGLNHPRLMGPMQGYSTSGPDIIDRFRRQAFVTEVSTEGPQVLGSDLGPHLLAEVVLPMVLNHIAHILTAPPSDPLAMGELVGDVRQ